MYVTPLKVPHVSKEERIHYEMKLITEENRDSRIQESEV
jgi:hypothetical protein